MYCANCGSEVDENKNFCRICGAPVGAQSVTVPAQQIAVADTEPAGTTAAPVASKKKASVGSVITLIICVTLDAINFLVSGAFLCIAALVAFIAPFGMMIGAYYEEAYLTAFLVVIVTALSCAFAVMGIVSSIVNCSMSKKGNKKEKPYFAILPFFFTAFSLIINLVSVIVYANM